jgi:predicted nucleic acid-binding protein
VLYLDASALVKRYVDEHDGATAIMDQFMVDAGRWGGLTSSEWLILEVTSALTRKLRGGTIASDTYQRLLPWFRADAERLRLIEVKRGVPLAASRLMETVQGADRFHSGDAIHLHTAMQLQIDLDASDTLVFVTSDDGLRSVVARYNIPAFDPRSDRIPDLERLIDG